MSNRAAPEPRGTYHHGKLREALLEAAVALVQEQSPEAVSVREVARRAGVSSGAPFRHFPDKTALMTAVAEEGTRRLMAEIEVATVAAGDDPVKQFRAIGVTFVLFAVRNPGHFRVMNMPEYADRSRSAYLGESTDAGEREMRELLARARAEGQILPWDPGLLMIASRALVYGVARMFIDGHFAELGVGVEQAQAITEAVTDIFGGGLVRATEAERGPSHAEPASPPPKARSAKRPATTAKPR